MVSGIYFGILSGMCSNIVSGIYSDILSRIQSGIYSDILSGIQSGILSGILSGIELATWLGGRGQRRRTRGRRRRRISKPSPGRWGNMFQQIHMILRLLPCGKLTWLLNMAILKMMIFHSYFSLPEGITTQINIPNSGDWMGWWF